MQSNFNGSNTFGTMKISSRQGKFEPMRVDNSARSGGIIMISLIFYNMKVCFIEAIRKTTYNLPFSNLKTKTTLTYPKSAAKGLFPWDSRMSSKQPW